MLTIRAKFYYADRNKRGETNNCDKVAMFYLVVKKSDSPPWIMTGQSISISNFPNTKKGLQMKNLKAFNIC